MKKLFLLSVSLIFIFSSCSGGESSLDDGEGSPKTVPGLLKGLVSDPPISGAQVELRRLSDNKVAQECGSGKTKIQCRSFTDENGLFSMIIPKNFDYSKYYLKTYGGKDEKTGINFYDLSLESPLGLYADKSKAVVSPVTTLMQAMKEKKPSITNDEMIENINKALGLGDIDPSMDPSENDTLLKRSYVLVKTALAYRDKSNTSEVNSIEPFKAISRAVNGGNAIIGRDGTFSHFFLDKVFYESSSEPDYAQIKKVLTDSAYNLANLTGTTDEVLNKIRQKEITAGFKNAFLLAAESSGNSSGISKDLLKANIEKLAVKIQEKAENIPLDDFIITQLAKYAIFREKSFGTYEGLTANDFTDKLETFTNLEKLSESLNNIISAGSVNLVTLPLGESDLIGDDNKKRIAYYYNSDLDYNYKAMDIVKYVFDDEIHDDIYLAASNSYAYLGLYSKADAIANAYLHNSMNKAKAKSYIAKKMIRYGEDSKSIYRYIKEAEAIVTDIYNARGDGKMTKDEGGLFVEFSGEYAAAGYMADSARLKLFISSSLNEIQDDGQRLSIGAKLYHGLKKIAMELVDENLPNASDAVDFIVKFIEIVPRNKKNGVQIVGTQEMAHLYRLLGDKEKVLELWENYKRYGDFAAGGAGNSSAYEFFKQWAYKIVGDLYWAGATDDVSYLFENDLFKYKKVYSSGRVVNKDNTSKAVRAVAVEKISSENYDQVIGYIEDNFPLKADYSNIGDYVDMMTYNQTSIVTDGFARAMLDKGNTAAAIKALVYIENKLDELVEFCKNSGQDLTEFMSELVKYDKERYSDSRYSPGGYLKIAYLYNKAGYTAEAEQAFDKAVDVVKNLPSCLLKSSGYATIAYNMKEAGYDEKAASLFAEAQKELNNLSTDFLGDKGELVREFIETAQDNLVINNRENMREALENALKFIPEIYEESVDDEKMRVASMRLYQAGTLFAKLPDIEKFKSTMEKSLEAAGLINSEKNKIRQYKFIIEEYGEAGFRNLGIIKAKTLFTKQVDYYDILGRLAESLTDYDDFENVDIAVVDTDHDGNPNFFLPGATAEDIEKSGLILDDDSDGDGILDIKDYTPLYSDN